MNHCVPDFEIEDDCSIPESSGLARPKKSSFMAEEEIMELLWQNGQVIAQRSSAVAGGTRKSSPLSKYDAATPAEFHIRHDQQQQQQQHLFMQEDEMASWLHYPLVDEDFSADLLYPAPAVTATTAATASAPVDPPGPSCSKSAGGGVATVVDSCDTPALGGRVAGESSYGGGLLAVSAKEAASSPGDSSASAEPPPPPQPAQFPPEDRKRKGVEPTDEADCQSEDVEFESGDTKKQARGTSLAKRTRAAEVHNLSERRRRDRINEKMKALQELIPRCNKSDKASMLDEAIEYLKSLQLQVQMMSMGCGMVPMIFPGIQQYMPPMGMGIGMGMGMGMDMGMPRPMMPFPNMLAGSAMSGPAAAAHMGPRFPIPAFHMPSVPHTAEPSRAQPTNQPELMFQPFVTQNPNQSRIPNFPDPYQQYLGSHQMQLPVLPQHSQNQATVQPSTSKPSTSRGLENPENHQSG